MKGRPQPVAIVTCLFPGVAALAVGTVAQALTRTDTAVKRRLDISLIEPPNSTGHVPQTTRGGEQCVAYRTCQPAPTHLREQSKQLESSLSVEGLSVVYWSLSFS